MRGTTSFALIALLAAACVQTATAQAAMPACSTLVGQTNCSAQSTCTWTMANGMNSCMQTQNCPAIPFANCASMTACTPNTVNTCPKNATVCALTGTPATMCNTNAGCIAGYNSAQCVATNTANWGCAAMTAQAGLCPNSYCMQDPASPLTCANKAISTCPAGAMTPLATCNNAANANVCAITAVTCQDACMANTTLAACDAAGAACAFNAATNVCAAVVAPACAGATASAAACNAVAGCMVEGYNCSTLATTYCSAQTSTNCASNATVMNNCQLMGKSCINNTAYCDVNNAAICGATNLDAVHCTAPPTCTNNGTCGQTTMATCNSPLCSWTVTNSCLQTVTNAQCQGMNASSTTCSSMAGCLFMQGGMCSTKADDTTSSNTLIFVSSLAAIALAL